MNSAQISGNLTRDVEIVETKSEWSILKFTIANNDESVKNSDGTWDNVTSFFDIELLTNHPQSMIRGLIKGASVVIHDAKLKQQTWEKDGNKRSKVLLSVKTSRPWENILFIAKKGEAVQTVAQEKPLDDVPF